jgi:hypothetical protein
MAVGSFTARRSWFHHRAPKQLHWLGKLRFRPWVAFVWRNALSRIADPEDSWCCQAGLAAGPILIPCQNWILDHTSGLNAANC